MMDALWHAAFLAANLWGANSADQIPFVNRLHRTVGYAEESQEIAAQTPGTRVVACWENRGESLVGSVYVFCEETKRPIAAAGRIELQAFDMAPALKGEEPRLLAQWTFHPDMLEKLQRKDLIGAGYTLTVNWADMPAKVENIKLQTVFVPAKGASRSDEPTFVARQSGVNEMLPVVQAEERPTKVVQAQAVSNKGRSRQLTLADVIRLSKARVAPAVILGQIDVTDSARGLRLSLADVVKLSKVGDNNHVIFGMIQMTESVFDLSVDDLIYLHENGVSWDVTAMMQETMRKRAVGPTTPLQVESNP